MIVMFIAFETLFYFERFGFALQVAHFVVHRISDTDDHSCSDCAVEFGRICSRAISLKTLV